jgi:hypothetical protein
MSGQGQGRGRLELAYRNAKWEPTVQVLYRFGLEQDLKRVKAGSC